MHWRNRRRVRRCASGRTVAYNLRFPGQVFDGQAGLHYNYFRDFDPAVGRYIESDPIGLAGGSYSTYAYAGNLPVLFVDPSGLADLNLLDPTPGGHDSTGTYAGGNVWSIPGVYTVAGHGNPGNMEDDRNGYKPLYPADLAKLIQDDPNWNHKPVMLGACNTGQAWENGHGGKSHWDSFAQMLGNLLGVPVTAPLGFARYSASQGLLGSTPTMTGPVNGAGQWRSYYPVK